VLTSVKRPAHVQVSSTGVGAYIPGHGPTADQAGSGPDSQSPGIAPPQEETDSLLGGWKIESDEVELEDGDDETAEALELRKQGERLLESKTEADFPKGIGLLFEAIDKGSAVASYRLGLVCAKARVGLPKDERLATELWGSAAKRGNLEACFALGCCFELGRGVSKDISRALYFWQFAALRGQEQAKFMYQFASGNKEKASNDPSFAAFIMRNSHNKKSKHKLNMDACLKIYAGVVRRRCLYC